MSDTRVGPNPFTTGVRPAKAPFKPCENCAEMVMVVLKCPCRDRFGKSCYDCGEPTDEAGVHFAMAFCPGFMPVPHEYCDGWENPEYQADRQAFWAAMSTSRKAFDEAVERGRMYRETQRVGDMDW